MFQEKPKYSQDFFDLVLGDRTGYVSIGHTTDQSLGTCTYRFFPAQDEEAIANYIDTLPSKSQVLFGLGRLGQIPSHGRGKADDVVAFRAIAMDIDIHSEAKEFQNLPRSLDEAIDLINTFPLRPSAMMKSGSGLHVYWRLNQDVVIGSTEEREAAKSLVANFHEGVNSYFAPADFDNTQDLSRILRAPGFLNLKDPNNPLTVELLYCDLDVSYSIEEILSVSVSRSRTRGEFSLTVPLNPGSELDFEKMADGCAWLRDAVSTHGNIGHNAWFATGSIMSLTKDGNSRFHQWSSGSPDYDFDDAQAKYEQIDPSKARRACTSLASIQKPELCTGCVFSGGIQSPVELAEPGPKAIHVSGQQLPVLTSELWAATHVKNSPPRLFAMNGLLARVNEQRGLIEILDETSAKHVFARMGLWVHPSREKEGWGSHAQPSISVIKDALATPFPPVPPLMQVTQVPVLTAQGKILFEFGYDADSQIYYANNGSIRPQVNLEATQEDASNSAAWIFDEVLHDFPFNSQSSKAHALALAIQSFVRPAIEGPTPFFLIDKPVAGTGATLLARTLTHPYLGRDLAAKQWPSTEDELRKQVTAHLLSGSNPYFFDNLEGDEIDSNILASVLTAPVYADRLLQRSQDVELVNRAAWIGTGNNPTFAPQLARRAVRIRMVSPLADPTQAAGFKHENLDSWVREHRNEYAEHLLTMISGWVNAGMPLFSGTPLASYVSWSEIIGGILEFSGVTGFLDDAEEKADLVAVTQDLAPALIEEWFNSKGSKPLSPKEIGAAFEHLEVAVLWDAFNDQGRASKVGTYMRGIKERIYEINTEQGKCTVQVTSLGRKWVVREVK
jgi:hypothetical protein